MKSWGSTGSVLWMLMHAAILAIGVFVTDSSYLSSTFDDPITDAVGTSLIATGAAGMLLFVYVQRTDTLRNRLEIFTKAGLTSIFPNRAARIRHEYDARLKSAKEIDVVGWGLSNFREDYGDQFSEWSQRRKVRILMVDPDYPSPNESIADLRDAEEKRPTGDIRRHVAAFQELLTSEGLSHTEGFQVRLMGALPAINLLRADDEIFWGPYLMGLQSRNTPTLIAQRGGFLYDVLKAHFDAVWELSAPSTEA